MRIGIPRESKTGETLVAATATTATQLTTLGYDVVVEASAGTLADQPTTAFDAAGIRIGTSHEVWTSDIVVKINAPTDAEIDRLHPGTTLVSLMAPARNPELIDKLAAAHVTALAMDAVPRISRAQSLDALSSMANVAGYRAVIEAAHEFGRQFTGQVTAAGNVPPARVFVIGAGVAGLAAIGAAGSMGAVVRAFDVRPEVAEQVESMGAQFVRVSMDQEVSVDGYAKEMTAEQELLTAEMYDQEVRNADIVITTALIPGRPAPRLIRADTVAAMASGSVIVDMAAPNGGNCELTQADEKVLTDNLLTILGYTDLAGRMAAQTSQLYGTNVVNLLKLLTPQQDGQLTIDLDDAVQRGMTVAHHGKKLWPPPPVPVSATPVAPPAEVAPAQPKTDPRRRWYAAGLAAAAFALMAAYSPTAFLTHFTVFVLAVFIGYYVISNVAHALHTPLMSETNAISGIILVGGILQVGNQNLAISALALVAVLVASINIFGGFRVTLRMLEMFRKD
ncbi:MAG: Re/Si-specific NAD(P)(+) transhydrogenase subunit alpha [Nocardioides sp.]